MTNDKHMVVTTIGDIRPKNEKLRRERGLLGVFPKSRKQPALDISHALWQNFGSPHIEGKLLYTYENGAAGQ